LQRLQTALTDRFRIERTLGRGGMATVFLGEDLKHHRQVALKVLDPELAAAIGPERFLREIETAARLTHPHVLPLFDSGEADGLLYYTMPYVEGESLRDRLGREKQLPLDDALRIAKEVADALGYAHSRGVIHRDIKPENILLQSGHAVVADFGIARAVAAAGGEALTATGIVVGTPAYMSPEQAAGSGVLDGRSDLYSLGCVLYEMLAGQPPFTGPTVESLVRQHLNVTPRPVTELRTAVPQATVAALHRVLAKTPADRYVTTGEFAAALVPGETLTARAGEPARGLPRSALVAGAVAALALGAWLAWSPLSAWLRHRNAPAQAAKKEWILVAEFEGPNDEPDLARAAQAMTATALDQSGLVMTVPRDQLGQALEQAGRPDTLRVDGRLGRELAYRSGIRSVLEGRVSRVGTGYSLALRLSDSGSDSTLITVDGSARDRDALIPTIDRLARRLRQELGENPAAVRATRGLNVIITPSFEAYRKIDQGADHYNATGDAVGSMRFLRDALLLDPDCAYAYLDKAVNFQSQGKPDSAVWASDQALSRPRRLTDEQRLAGEAGRALVRADFAGARQAVNRQLQLYPAGPGASAAYSDRAALNVFEGRYIEGMEDSRRCVESGAAFGAGNVALSNRANCERMAGQLDAAERTASRLGGGFWQWHAVHLAVARNNWARAESLCASPPRDMVTDPRGNPLAAAVQVALAGRRGEVRAAQDGIARAVALWGARNDLSLTPRQALFLALVSGTPVPELDAATAHDTTTGGVITRGWHAALVGDVAAARGALSELRRRSPDELARAGAAREFLEASIAAAEHRWSDVIRLIGSAALRGDDGGFSNWRRIGPVPERWLVAEAWEHVGPPDSAAAAFERVLLPPQSRGIVLFVPYAHQRLVMIYASMGRLDDAERHWEEFSATFTNPDPEVKHLFDEARAVIMELRAMAHPRSQKG